MNDLKKLLQHRDDILRAEMAGWLHNIGKLDPNFLVQQTKESPKTLGLYCISGQYSFRRFTTPSVLRSKFIYGEYKGVFYFRDVTKRQEAANEIAKLDEEIGELQNQLRGIPANRGELAQRLKGVANKKSQILLELDRAEEKQQADYEQRIETLTFSSDMLSGWPLGSLLTLFWEDWFDRPSGDLYEPGSEGDTDYQRKPKEDIILQPGFSMEFPLLFLLAHGEVSGQEKKGMGVDDQYVKVREEQESAISRLRISTAFGYEEKASLAWENWPFFRKEIIDLVFASWNDPKQSLDYHLEVFRHLRQALGDTQRPINEISLWDYSRAVAALFKTAVAQAMLTGQVPTPGNMHWRLASVRLNAFDFLFQVNQLADLLARQKLLQGVWDTVRTALEVETPIGSAVYADENGLVFVLPEWPGKSNEEIRRIIEVRTEEAIKAATRQDGGPIGAADLRPNVQIRQPQRGKKLLLGKALPAEEPLNIPDPAVIQNYWSNHQNQERCHVCGLRPVGYFEDGLPPFVTEEKARERNLCGICLARRGRRSEEWATKREFKETIWIDEVADSNGRMALVVGRFDLDEWLSGDLVRSLAIGTDEEKGNWLAKSPTFARVQRVWRTTAEFWQEVMDNVLKDLKDDRRRILLQLESKPDLGSYHVYELDLGKTTMSVVWCPDQNAQGGFLVSAANLGYIAKQLAAKDEEKDVFNSPVLSSIYVEDLLQKEFIHEKREPVLRNPEGASSERGRNLLSANRIVDTDHQNVAYPTAISILAEPRTFMILVPADKAMEIVKSIKTKYEREMGKVRNRLPLHLGVVFAHRRTPLRAVLDAGRQMLKQKAPGSHETWTVNASDQFNSTVTVELAQNGRELTWYVPLKMGDGQTEDCWYPYVFWKENADGCADPRQAGRERVFQGPLPGIGNCWLVHADELRTGDRIYFTPATFDFEWLDTNARRFEIAYDDYGRRYNRLTRPYLLDDYDRLERLWGFVRYLTATKRHSVISTIEATREAWYGQRTGQSLNDGVFRQFVADTLAGANWEKQPWKKIPREWQEKLVDAGVRGELADLAELHMEILKER